MYVNPFGQQFSLASFGAPMLAMRQQMTQPRAQAFGVPSAPESAPMAAYGEPTQQAVYEGKGDLAAGIIETANALGVDPLDLATVVSYETAGTFDPAKRGPTTQWGQHRGLIQFGEPQAKKYGVDWNDPLGSQLGPDGAIAKYMRASGLRPGMGLLDMYSTVNAGAPGLYNRSDANNGGAPGTVRDKVENQMAGHRRNAERLLGPRVQQPDSGANSIDALLTAIGL